MEKRSAFHLEIDEENMDIQEKYFYWLDKIITATSLLRYEQDVESNEYVSSAQLYDDMIAAFLEKKRYKTEYKIIEFVRKMAIATGNKEETTTYLKYVKELYHYYEQEGKVKKEMTAPLFNEILNKQQDRFCRDDKRQITAQLRHSLNITKKKKEQQKRSIQLRKMREILKTGTYEKLGLTENKRMEITSEVNEYAKNMKYFRKNKINMPKDLPFRIGYLFFTDEIDYKEIQRCYSIFLPETVIKQIVNQYYKKTTPILEKIEVSSLDIDDRKNVAYDYNHLIIASRSIYEKNVEELLQSLNTRKIKMETLERKENTPLLQLLPLVGLINEFSMREMIQILNHSTQIFSRLKKEDDRFGANIEEILNRFHEVLRLAKVYANVTPLVIKILGEEIVTTILNNDPLFLSRNPKEFLPYYREMLKCTEKKIPPISGVYQDYTFESGKMSDTTRLMMGSHCVSSCLGPTGAGEEAFRECLMGENADILIIKDKEENFIARTLLFRKGNYIVMSSIVGDKGIRRQFYNKEFLSLITNQLLEKTAETGDKLDYIFLTREEVNTLEDYLLIVDDDIVDNLPHVDWRCACFLIGGEEKEINLNEKVVGKYYAQTRDKVRSKEEISDSDIEKIKALDIYFQEKPNDLDRISGNTSLDEWEQIYLGQDWYFGLRKNGSISSLLLSTNDKRQRQEVEYVKNILNTENLSKIETKCLTKIKK